MEQGKGIGQGRPVFGPQVWKAVLAIVLAQLAYWLVVKPITVAPPTQPESYETFNPAVARIDVPTYEALSKAQFKPIEFPWWDCCRGYYAFRMDWTMDRVPPEGVGLIPAIDADNTRIYVNGQLIHAPGRIEMPDVSHYRVRTVLFVSPGLVKPGINRVEYIMVREALPYFDLAAPPKIGFYPTFARVYAGRMFVFNEYATISFTIGFVLSIIAIAVAWRAERKGFPLWVAGLALSWSMLSNFAVWTDPPFSSFDRVIYYFALTNFMPIAWLNLADAWTERPHRWIAWASLAIYLLAMGATAWAWYFQPMPGGFDLASDITNWLSVGFSFAAVARFLWHLARHRDNRFVEVGIFALCVSLIFYDRLYEIMSNTAKGNVVMNTPILLFALVLAYLLPNVRLFRSATSYNAELEERVSQREAQLELAYVREREHVRREAHDFERLRIMRDMHDGLGSQLMSMLLAARRKALSSENMAEGLQSVMDEMRLILESMDSVGESLSSALAMFRARTTERVRQAGLTFAWNDTYQGEVPHLTPREVLNVFRVLQEAVNNALRHSGADTVSVAISPAPLDGGGLRIVVSDNGKGLAGPPGRGLGNMASRANALGARFAVENGETGVRVVLDLPAQRGALA